MPRKSDRMYITQTEHSGVHGRHTAAGGGHLDRSSSSSQYQPLPYTSCAISLQQWINPVCDKEDGTTYELTNILPWLKKYGSSPASGKPLRAADLVALRFHKNEATGAWHDPVSYKAFNDSTHLVAIATSGNVFAYDTIQQLNIKAKAWADLLTGESFTRKDLITLQDPNNVSGKKNIANLRHLKDGLTLTAADRGNKDDTDEVNLSATGSASTLLKKLKEQREGAVRAKDEAGEAALEKMKKAGESSKEGSKEAAATVRPSSSKSATYTKPAQAHNAGIASTGRMGAAFTSSGLTSTTVNQRELISEEETMYDEIRKGAGKGKAPMKGYVRLVTNFGPLNLELHCDTAPKTCYNFLTLCRRGKYNDTTFHRNIPGFMVQGGDLTGTGRGGESMWGKPFSDELSSSPGHKTRGCLSMANRGPDTNTSQFFITYAPKTHLDKKHTVFGQLVDSPSATLDALELVPTEAGTDKPLRTIRIMDVQIYADPFADYQEKLHRRLHRDDDDQVAQREEKRRKREEDRTTWLGTQLGDKSSGKDEVALSNLTPFSTGVGKYLPCHRLD
jgi:peptidyl-prolyl cis-trans isomerase-like 2